MNINKPETQLLQERTLLLFTDGRGYPSWMKVKHYLRFPYIKTLDGDFDGMKHTRIRSRGWTHKLTKRESIIETISLLASVLKLVSC